MAFAVVTVDDSLVKSALRRLNAKLDDPHDFLEQVGVQASKDVETNFDRATDSNGSPWQALSLVTIKNKHSDRILVDTGLLKRIEWRVIGRQVEIGSQANYGEVHQFGGTRGNAKIPQREWLYLNDAAVAKIRILAETWLQNF